MSSIPRRHFMETLGLATAASLLPGYSPANGQFSQDVSDSKAIGRIQQQLEAVGPQVDTVLFYQYQGLMSKPGSKAHAGHPDAEKLYRDYLRWLNRHHPDVLTTSGQKAVGRASVGCLLSASSGVQSPVSHGQSSRM